MPRDGFGREIDYLRFSLTDHCNLRCVYCMPESGLRFLPSGDLLTAAETAQAGRAAVSGGFRKFRLTGGGPALRAGLVEIVTRLARIPGTGDLSMTTNAILLPRLGADLRGAGLRRGNIHVDSLAPARGAKARR